MVLASDRQLIELQLALEGIGFDPRGRLIRIAAAATEEIPRLSVCHYSGAWTRFYRADVPQDIVDDLDKLSDLTCFENPDQVRRVLARQSLSLDVWIGTSYVFPAAPPIAACPDVTRLEAVDRPMATGLDSDLPSSERPVFAIVVDGRIVATCVSARENEVAAEAWVQTSPDYRRRGLARQVTAAWARDVVTQGKIAFYSHRRDNLASRGVAASLGLTRFVDGAGYL